MTSDGEYITLKLTPTVNKNTTEYNAKGAWVDSNRIRFKDGQPQQLGGWQIHTESSAFTGIPRDIFGWVEVNGTLHYAVGTDQKLQIDQSGTIYDITPIVVSVSSTNIISTSSGSIYAIVSVPSHGRSVGDFIEFTSVTSVSVGGITFQGKEFVVASVITANAYQVITDTTAASNIVSGGGLVKLDCLLAVGTAGNAAAAGYGAGTYGTFGASASSGWSDPRGGSLISLGLRQWSLDNWGENLIACPKGGAIYQWVASTSVQTRAQVIATAPATNNIIMIAHPDRILVALGTVPVGGSVLDPLYVRWSDREDNTDWTPTAQNRSGGFRLGAGSYIVGAAQTQQQTIIFTDSAVYSMTPTNDTFVFDFELISHNAGLVSQNGAAGLDTQIFWWGKNNFFIFNGVVQTLPCTVRDFVFNDIDPNQRDKTFAGNCRQFGEIFWFYQSTSTTTGDIDKYVKYNYMSQSWDVGTLSRTVWMDAQEYDHPIAVDVNGVAYDHEIGTDDNGSPMNAFVKSAYYDLGDGTTMLLLDQIMPDFVQSGVVNFTVNTQKTPDGPITTKGPYMLTTATSVINLKAKGRQAQLEFSTDTVGSSFKLGRPRYRVKSDGER